MRVFFLSTPQLDELLHEVTCSANMHLDTPFGDTITAVCAALGWREQDWVFLFDPWIWLRVPPDRTPRFYDLDNYDEVWIYCVPAEANN